MLLGSVYEIKNDLGDIKAGVYAVMEVGHLISIARLWSDEDGYMRVDLVYWKVTQEEMETFEAVGIQIFARTDTGDQTTTEGSAESSPAPQEA